MVDSMFVTQCLDMNCLCHQEEYQKVSPKCNPLRQMLHLHVQRHTKTHSYKSLFQCLYSQCDSNEYGNALSRTISTCMKVGAEIYMVAPGSINDKALRVREADYLSGRPLAEIPGVQLRQESNTVATITATVTADHTFTLTLAPTHTPFMTADPVSTSINRPWVITQSDSSRFKASFSGMVLWIAIVLLQDYWFNGY